MYKNIKDYFDGFNKNYNITLLRTELKIVLIRILNIIFKQEEYCTVQIYNKVLYKMNENVIAVSDFC